MIDSQTDLCGKCGAEIDSTRRVDCTLKDGTRVCDAGFVNRDTASVATEERVVELRPLTSPITIYILRPESYSADALASNVSTD
jgi:hypothetical protein